MKNQISPEEDALLAQAESKGPLGKAGIYVKLSGPGWLQGAVTLGGGSLAGALYVGIISGYHLSGSSPSRWYWASLCFRPSAM